MSLQTKKTPIERINMRNILATLFSVGYFAFLFYSVEKGLTAENPVLTMLLAIMSTAEVLIVQFFFRKPSSKEAIG